MVLAYTYNSAIKLHTNVIEFKYLLVTPQWVTPAVSENGLLSEQFLKGSFLGLHCLLK